MGHRGAVPAMRLHMRPMFPSNAARRVVVKTRIHKLAGTGAKAAKAHLKYLEREAGKSLSSEHETDLEQPAGKHEPAILFDAETDQAKASDFHDRCQGDRHQFRVIVAPEDGHQLADLRDYTRDLMASMERDLGTKLDWVAVNHYDTGHPHAHVLVRGKDSSGKDLVIDRDYIAHGMRSRAVELATLELGHRQEHEIRASLIRQVDQERLTDIDRRLLSEQQREGTIDLRHGPHFHGRNFTTLREGAALEIAPGPRNLFHHSVAIGRLRSLRAMELAHEEAPGRWRIDNDAASTAAWAKMAIS